MVRLSALSAIAVFAACGGGDKSPGVTPPTLTPTVAVTSASATLTASSIAPGVANISIVRGGGFSGAVTLTAEGLPTGVTATFGAATLAPTVTATTVTLSVAATAVAGVTPMTIRATGAGVSASTTVVQLTVVVPAINLAAASTTISAQQGATATVALTLERLGGFAGAVSLVIEGLPANVTGSFAPTSLAAGATTSTLTIVAGASAAAGTTPITVRATGAGVTDRTVVLQLTVTATPTVPLVPISWTVCDATRIPAFIVVRDGLAGPWRSVTPTGTTYAFTLAGNIGTVAIVQLSPLNRLFVVYETYMTVVSGTSAELASRLSAECTLQPTRGKTVFGSLAPVVGASELAFVTGGWGNALLGAGGSTFSLADVALGSIDVIATRFAFNATLNGYQPSQLILRRGVNLANGATMPVFDFSSTEAFAPVNATITIANLNGDRVSVRSAFDPTASAQLVLDNGTQSLATTHAQYGIPVARMIAGELHEATITAVDPTNTSIRQAVAYAQSPTSRTITLGASLSAPTLSVTNGAVARPRARGAVQPDYNKSAIAIFTQQIARKQAWVEVTPGYLAAAANYDLEVPDLSAAPGFNPVWGLTVGSPINYNLYMSNAPFAFATAGAGTFSLDGVVWLYGLRTGNVP